MATVDTFFEFLLKDPQESVKLYKKQLDAINKIYDIVLTQHHEIGDTKSEDHEYFADGTMEMDDYLKEIEAHINILEKLNDTKLPKLDYNNFKQDYLDIEDINAIEQYHKAWDDHNEMLKYLFNNANDTLDFLMRNLTDRIHGESTDTYSQETSIDEENDLAPDDDEY